MQLPPIRADHAFDGGRGVHMPRGWAELCAPPPEAAMSCHFTPEAAREAAKGAAQKAIHKLGDAGASVACGFFPSLFRLFILRLSVVS